MKKFKIWAYVIWVLLLARFLSQAIPATIHSHKLNKIQNEILLHEEQIEANKQQRLNCSTNMQLWNNENEETRKIVQQLKEKYNSMAGFTQASQ